MDFEDLIEVAYDLDATLYGNIQTDDLLKYLIEEVREFREVSEKLDNGPKKSADRLNQIEELGDILFVLLAIARQKDINVSHALSLTLIKLQDRLKRNEV